MNRDVEIAHCQQYREVLGRFANRPIFHQSTMHHRYPLQEKSELFTDAPSCFV